MTTPTKEQCAQWARECEASVANIQVGQAWLPWKISFRPDQLHAFALKVLAESEDRRDAERYRWLVENATIMTARWTHDSLDPCSTKYPLDQAIGAAIEAERVRG